MKVRRRTSKGRKRALPRIATVEVREAYDRYHTIALMTRLWPGGKEKVRQFVLKAHRDLLTDEILLLLDAVDRLCDPKTGEALSVRMLSAPASEYPGLTYKAQRLVEHYRVREILEGYPAWIKEDDNIPLIGTPKTVAKSREELEDKEIIKANRVSRGFEVRFLLRPCDR